VLLRGVCEDALGGLFDLFSDGSRTLAVDDAVSPQNLERVEVQDLTVFVYVKTHDGRGQK
jgi:hypothetical protein